MAGTTSTTRVQGVPSGYPAEINSNLTIRVVDEEILDLSQVNELQILKLFGGFDNPLEKAGMKYEWMLNDQWKMRDTVGNSPLSNVGTALDLSGNNAHRYPRGTILKIEDELVWVQAQADANTLTIVRAYAGTSAVEHANGTEILVAGFSEVEGTDWTLRQTADKSFVYNHMTIMKTSVKGSWANEAIRKYGIPAGQDINEQMARSLKQAVQSFNNQLLLGQRYAGGGANDPSTMGGIDFFVTSANGAYVSDLNGASLTLKDIHDMVQNRFYEVGAENVGTTLLCDYWSYRKINSFFDTGVRLETTENHVGLRVQKLRTPIGDLDVIFDPAVPKGSMYLLSTNNLSVVKLPDPSGFPPSRLHIGMSGQSNEGDYTQMYMYGVYGCQVKNVSTMGKIHDFSTTS